ncbi:MAG: cadmium-translocating P-type ATPase [Faecalicoccus sp.]|nr:cadmium-translocating P-type ATPase [Faecalicoccus sp.]
MTKKQKKMLKRIGISAVLFIAAVIADHYSKYVSIPLFVAAYILVGSDVLRKSWKNICNGQVFDENFLMAIASLGAFALGEYSESVAVMLFYQVGEWFQSYAVNRSRQSIADLMDIRPDYANIERDGGLVQVDPEEVSIGDEIVIQPGERIPLDGIVSFGQSSIDTSALTGESVPRHVSVDDEVISGCINQTGLLKVKVQKEFTESTVTKILELVENAGDKKSRSENFITKFARYYTPIVVYSALALAIIPSLITGQWTTWIYRALTFLVISCPCALVISVPLSFFGGIGGASSKGILVKGSNYLEDLSQVKTIVFDKTGTLTKGVFEVTAVHPEAGYTEAQLLNWAAQAESYSTHPIAKSIREAANFDELSKTSDVEEIAGHGVKATVGDKTISVGNAKLMKQLGIEDVPASSGFATRVYCAVDGNYAGYIDISDRIKENSIKAISELKENGIEKTVMLTGDSQNAADDVAGKLHIDEVFAQLLPADKVEQVERLLEQCRHNNTKLAFVGDGINDAPVLTRADIGIAMGGLGSDAAIEAADIVLMDDDPLSIVTAIRISRKTLKIVRQNIVFAIGVKVLVLMLGALGVANMWAAVFADVGVAIIAILNAMRCMHIK